MNFGARMRLLFSVAVVILTACGDDVAPANVPASVAPIPAAVPTVSPVAGINTRIPAPSPTVPPVRDSDRDGLLDREELQLGTDPFQRDSDVDGLYDADEIRLGTDPLAPDTDRDSIRDGDEMRLGTDPLAPDTDRDSIRDGDEMRLGTGPLTPDTDRDGVSDGDEMRLGTGPLTADTDGDGVVDGDDVSPLADAKVKVSIVEFIDKTRRGVMHGDTNAYFTIVVDDAHVTTPIYPDVQHERIEPVVVDVDDSLLEVTVGVLAWESAPVAGLIEDLMLEYFFTVVTGFPIKVESQDHPYDMSPVMGSDADAKILVLSVPANGTAVLTGDGTDDGVLGPLEAEITVKVEHGSY